LAYVENLIHEHHFTLPDVMLKLRLAAGLHLLEARAARIAPDHSIGYVERAIMHARAAVRVWYEERFEIIPTPPRIRAPV
jgi:hypothetical protein